MRPSRAPSIPATAVFLLLCVLLPTALAHGDEGGSQAAGGMSDMGSDMDMDMKMDMGVDPPQEDYPPTYFAHPEHAGLICGHIGLMVAAWVFVLPVAVMLSLSNSRHTLTSQFVFTILNAVGVLLGAMYNAQTPDLYPGNAHHSIGWIITWIMTAHVLVGLAGRLAGRTNRLPNRYAQEEEHRFLPISNHTDEDGSGQRLAPHHGYRLSDDSVHISEPTTDSVQSDSVSTHVGDDEDMHLTGHKEYDDVDLQDMPYSTATSAGVWLNKIIGLVSSRFWAHITLGYKIVDRIILPFGFVAFTTGIVAYGRLFEGNAVFGGLAHWIKGGIFFWLGLFNLGRWTGSFAELGWAWNIRPRNQNAGWRPSAEFVESFLIFLYGSTNIFLEHLGNWGEAWRAQDLEHLSITVLFIGGGLCGMLIESALIRDLLNTKVSLLTPEGLHVDIEREQFEPPRTYEFSLNPFPALVILLLGIMMSSHHQQTMTSTMVHKQWGNLLTGASFARGLTYVIIYIRPPQSIFPSRPPTELLCSFGLIAGGIIFMASSSDTVDGMIHYNLDAMFMYTVTMGLVGVLMAWEMLVLAIKGWAARHEHQLTP